MAVTAPASEPANGPQEEPLQDFTGNEDLQQVIKQGDEGTLAALETGGVVTNVGGVYGFTADEGVEATGIPTE